MIANTELQRVGLSGWRTGLANLLRKENRTWWTLRRLLVQSILWTVIIGGIVVITVRSTPRGAEITGDPQILTLELATLGVTTLFGVAPLALGIAAIVLLQDAIIGERQLGVTEWLLSKPASRSAYVLAKLLAHGLGTLVILVGLQSALGYGLLWLLTGALLPLPGYLVGVAGLAVHTLFYLALTLMMGVLTTKRGVVLGVSLGFLLIGSSAGKYMGMAFLYTPWGLGSLLSVPVFGASLPVPIGVSMGITALLAIIFVAVALVRFERLEF